ncbi:hypothetical protein ACTFIU_005957 [Dictyostelium citrinum]
MSTSNTNNLFSYEKYTKPEGLEHTDQNEDFSDDSDVNDFLDNESFSVNKSYKNNGGGGISKPKKNLTKKQPQQLQQPSQQQQQQPSEQTLETNKKQTKQQKQQQEEELNQTIEETNKTKKLTKSEVQSIIDDEIENKKKERLPSSEEVYNRILYDDLIKDKVDDFTIFYEDRFDGIKKAAFKSFEFGVVPLHRIKKISYLNTIVWDRNERIYDFSIFDSNNNENNQNE